MHSRNHGWSEGLGVGVNTGCCEHSGSESRQCREKRGGRWARSSIAQTDAAGREIAERFREHIARNGEYEVERWEGPAIRASGGKGEQPRDGEMSRIPFSSKRKSGGKGGGFAKMRSDHDGGCSLEKAVSNAKRTCKLISDESALRDERRERGVSWTRLPRTRVISSAQTGRELSLADPFRKYFRGFMRHQDSCVRRTELPPPSGTARNWKRM
jgi:hypothetical protein